MDGKKGKYLKYLFNFFILIMRMARYKLVGSIRRDCIDCKKPKLCNNIQDTLTGEFLLLCSDCMKSRGLRKFKQ